MLSLTESKSVMNVQVVSHQSDYAWNPNGAAKRHSEPNCSQVFDWPFSVKPQNLETAVAYMRENWHLIADDETAYKTAFVAKARSLVGTAHRDTREWNTVFAKHRGPINQITGWRLVNDFRRLLKAHPLCLRDAIPALKESIDADAFWNTVENALGRESIDKTTYSQLQGVGARATIASLLLFLDDAHSYPMFRKLNYGRPLVRLTGEPLDSRTPGTLLSSYYAQIDRLKSWLDEAELPVQSNLDVQGVLWVLNYKRVLD